MKRYLRWARIAAAAAGLTLVAGSSSVAEARQGEGVALASGGHRGTLSYAGYRYRSRVDRYRGRYHRYRYRPGFGFYGTSPLYRPYVVWSYSARSGVGVGGLLFLFVMGGLIYAAIIASRRRAHMLGRPVGYDPFGGVVYEVEEPDEPVQVIKAQVALLGTARHVHGELDRLARHGDPNSAAGLATLLRETAILLVRQQPYWKAGFLGQETFDVPEEAERRFEEAVVGERVKIDPEGAPSPAGGEKIGRYIVVTLLLAVSGPLVDDNHTPSSDEMKADLMKLAAVPASQLRALEVLWAPPDPNGALDEDDLLLKYSALSNF